MLIELVIRYLHFLGILFLASSLIAEHLHLSKELAPPQLKRLFVLDAIYGVSALIVLATGLMLWLSVGKPSSFYTSNGVFHIKFTLFILMALASVYPTMFFFKNRKAESSIPMPKMVIMMVRVELLILLIIPALAVMMAKGIGL